MSICNFHPHLHLLATNGCFNNTGAFMVCPSPKTDDLEEFFRYKVLKLLRAEGKISDAVIENMMGWRHSGFNVFCGPTIWPREEKGMENLARYIIRASFSQERMLYIPAHDSPDGTAKVIYTSKDAKTSKTFDALDWLAQLVTHIPNRGEQMVRYYGFYSNRARGDRKKMGKDDELPALMAPEVSSTQLRRSWARLIQKIYHLDPLICPKCRAEMKIIAFIDAGDVIEKILRHLGLWQTHNHDPPPRKASHIPEFVYDDDDCQVPPVDEWLQ
jgi:hypothetical protein